MAEVEVPLPLAEVPLAEVPLPLAEVPLAHSEIVTVAPSEMDERHGYSVATGEYTVETAEGVL